MAKAASVGAKTVKGPPVLRVSTSPAALTAAFEVENSNAYYYVRRNLGN